MSIRNILIGSMAVCGFAVTGFANQTMDAMRAASAVQTNTKYSSSVSLTKDSEGNIISFHVNGVQPADASILLSKDNSPLTQEYTIITGITKEGGISSFMIPSNVAVAHVVESISQDLVNAGAVSIQITKQNTGRNG